MTDNYHSSDILEALMEAVSILEEHGEKWNSKDDGPLSDIPHAIQEVLKQIHNDEINSDDLVRVVYVIPRDELESLNGLATLNGGIDAFVQASPDDLALDFKKIGYEDTYRLADWARIRTYWERYRAARKYIKDSKGDVDL